MKYCLTITLKSRMIWRRERVIDWGAESRLATDRVTNTTKVGKNKMER